MSKCLFLKSDKTSCNANAITGDNYCFWHSKQTKEQRNQAVMDGGLSPKRSYGRDDDITINNTQDVLKLIEQTINDLRKNKTSSKLANAIGYLSGIALKTLEQGDLERRIETLEYAYKIKTHIK